MVFDDRFVGKVFGITVWFAILMQYNGLFAQISTTGPSCGRHFVSESGEGYYWSESANAKCDDNEDRSYSSPLTKGQFTQVLRISDFGFNLPADARVEGIEVVVIRKGDVGGALTDKSVMLTRGGTIVGSNLRSKDLWDDSWTASYYGDENEDWDVAWAVKDINSPSFGIAFSAMNVGAIARPEVDEVLLTVHYTYGSESARTHKASSSASRFTCNGWGS